MLCFRCCGWKDDFWDFKNVVLFEVGKGKYGWGGVEIWDFSLKICSKVVKKKIGDFK